MLTIQTTMNAALIAQLSAEVQQLHHELHPAVFKPFDFDAIHGYLEHLLPLDHYRALVAYWNDEPAGYLLLVVNDKPENPFQWAAKSVHIDQLCVLEQYRGNGIGAQLVEKALAFARQVGATRVDLTHWSSNTNARDFFRNCGFNCYHERMEQHL